ncbi:MAG: hypothetical protein KAQ75_15555 [Bacteroidales bacterium]|nr:hypothetical protein [Bacteroidales bacterium]
METTIITLATIILIVFPIWVAIHAWRKNYRTLAIILGISYLIPFVTPIIAIIAFFIVKPYNPNWDYIPNPRSFSGCGTKLYFASKKSDDGSFVSTQWFTIFFIPIFPIQSYRILIGGETTQFSGVYISSTTNFYVIENLRIEWVHVLKAYLFVISFIVILIGMIIGLSGTTTTKEMANMASSSIIGLLVVYAVIGYFLFRTK